MLNKAQQQKLLKIARDTIKIYLEESKGLDIKESDPGLNQKQGAFVTLKRKDLLRGCIGLVESDKPLYHVVKDMAIQSAFKDPRFQELKAEELSEVKIEISVMSKPEKVTNIQDIKVDTHGLIIRRGFYSGLLLPQVASEYKWSRKEFLENTCHKAGLSKDAYKTAEIYMFTAQVFSESTQ